MSLLGPIKAVEGAIGGEAKKVGHDLSVLFGPKVDAFKTAAEELLKTEAGVIVKAGVEAAKLALPNGPGAALHAIAAAFSQEALKQAGITVGSQLINLAIETILASA